MLDPQHHTQLFQRSYSPLPSLYPHFKGSAVSTHLRQALLNATLKTTVAATKSPPLLLGRHTPALTSTWTRHHLHCSTSNRSGSTSSSNNSNNASREMSPDCTASGPAAKRLLYGGHIPTTPWQRAAMAGWAAVSALRKPERADMVATLGEVTGRLALERLYRFAWWGAARAIVLLLELLCSTAPSYEHLDRFSFFDWSTINNTTVGTLSHEQGERGY